MLLLLNAHYILVNCQPWNMHFKWTLSLLYRTVTHRFETHKFQHRLKAVGNSPFLEYERGMIVARTQTGKTVTRQNPNFREGRPKSTPPRRRSMPWNSWTTHELQASGGHDRESARVRWSDPGKRRNSPPHLRLWWGIYFIIYPLFQGPKMW